MAGGRPAGRGERGWGFVAGMIAFLGVIFGLAALFGVPTFGALFFGFAGMLGGLATARALVPRRDWGLAGRTVLAFVAVGGIFVGSRFSVLDFFTVRGVFFWGVWLGFWSMASVRLAGLGAPGRTG